MPLIVVDIWRVIGEIRKSGIATLIVDRDCRRVLADADHALVLQKGQVVLQGQANAVANDPALSTYLGSERNPFTMTGIHKVGEVMIQVLHRVALG